MKGDSERSSIPESAHWKPPIAQKTTPHGSRISAIWATCAVAVSAGAVSDGAVGDGKAVSSAAERQ